jgi:hypothetical protein
LTVSDIDGSGSEVFRAYLLDLLLYVLLEGCLADKVAFVERIRRLIRHTIESKHALKLAA